jgi:S-adenosylmethionine-diacylglycerol 3-amino-3-carboxypropyl transferase
MNSEAAARADFSDIRYAQCWEDADVLLEGLEPGPGKNCLSIASAGDNTLALLARGPARVLAVDLSAAQIACVELRVAAYRTLQHSELLALMGSMVYPARKKLYEACRPRLSASAVRFWDQRGALIEQGIGSCGKFERYFRIFRRCIVPLIHTKTIVGLLMQEKSREQRIEFYEREWDNLRWKTMFRFFFSRQVMGGLGRDPEFFRYVKGSVADRILERIRYGFTELAPAESPYVQWIMTGQHNGVLPFALREENFEAIRRNLDVLELRCCALEDGLMDEGEFDCFNLSDVFEYMSPDAYESLLRRIIVSSRPGARLLYWNMLAPRSRPESLASRLESLTELSESLFARDKACFYSALVVERVR